MTAWTRARSPATVLAQAAPPTARATPWAAVLAVCALVAVIALMLRLTDQSGDSLAKIGAPALATAAVVALVDPAAGLLAPMPVSTTQRRLIRLVLVAVPVSGTWLVVTLVATTSPELRSAGPLLALTAAGVAAVVWAPPRGAVVIGATVPVLWFVLERTTRELAVVSDVTGLWLIHPWVVVASATLLCVAGRKR